MKKLKIRQILHSSIVDLDVIRISRNKIDSEPVYCFPLSMGKETLLVQYFYDFQLDGFKLIRLKDITGVRVNRIERFVKTIFIKEGIYKKIGKLPLVNLTDWENTFKNFKDLEKNLIIECESRRSSEFYIGKIIQVNKGSVLFLNFDALGQWDQDPTTICFKDITSVSFKSRYITMMSKYVS